MKLWGQLCDVRLHENEFYATKSQAILIFHPFVFYFVGNRMIHATVTDSSHLRSSVLVGIITSPLTSTSVSVTQ